MMRHALLGLLMVLPTLVSGQNSMSAAEFDAYVTGRTITFRTDLNPSYGTERYMEGRRLMWSIAAGICQYGVWFESKGDICFRYEGDPEHKCWTVYDEPGGLRGVYTTRPPFTVIFEVKDRQEPLICNDLSS